MDETSVIMRCCGREVLEAGDSRETKEQSGWDESEDYVSPQSLTEEIGTKAASMRNEKRSAARCKLVSRRWARSSPHSSSSALHPIDWFWRKNSATLGPVLHVMLFVVMGGQAEFSRPGHYTASNS